VIANALAWLESSRELHPPPPGVFAQDIFKPSIRLEEDGPTPTLGTLPGEGSPTPTSGTLPGEGSMIPTPWTQLGQGIVALASESDLGTSLTRLIRPGSPGWK
jgi:hypothetical protein